MSVSILQSHTVSTTVVGNKMSRGYPRDPTGELKNKQKYQEQIQAQ